MAGQLIHESAWLRCIVTLHASVLAGFAQDICYHDNSLLRIEIERGTLCAVCFE